MVSSVFNKMSQAKDELLKIRERLSDLWVNEPTPMINLVHWIKADLISVREMTQTLTQIANSMLEHCEGAKRPRKNRARKKKKEPEAAAAAEEIQPPTPPPPLENLME